jgi:chromate reductase, NAD(P)H dehydrogenase (quinone)
MFKLLGLAGSIRRASVSKAILQTLAEKVPAQVSLTIHDLADIPIYNQDLESNLPASVAALRQAIIDCDGMVIVSPEYNHGMSGVIKNAIDWVSRPGYASVLVNKGVAIITTSESPLGGARAQADLHKMFLSTLSRIAPGREVSIGNTQKTVVDGKLVDETQIRRALTLIDALLAEISMVQGRK